MALIYDVVDVQELTGFVRGIQDEEEANRFGLARVLPSRNIDDIEYRINRGELFDQDAAPIRAWDAEAPIGARQGVARLRGELPPISKKIRLGEEERLRLRQLQGGGDRQEMINRIYDDARNMARSVVARVELLRGEALSEGQIVIDENGIQATVDFDRDADMSPAAPTTTWDNVTTATPVADLQAWVEAYQDINGFAPAVALTSTRVLSNLLRNEEIRTLAGSLAGTPNLVTQATVQNTLQAFGLPPIQTYDVQVRVFDEAAGESVQSRVLPEDRLLLLPPAGYPLGNTFWGTTAEALELAEARQIGVQDAPGLVAVIDKTYDPVATWTKAAGISLPVLADANAVLAVDVITL